MTEDCNHLIGYERGYVGEMNYSMEFIQRYGLTKTKTYVDEWFNFCPLCGVEIPIVLEEWEDT